MTTYTNGTVARPELVEVHLDLIKPNPWQPRAEMDPEHIAELMENIDGIGLLQEPMARPSPAGDGSVQTAFGHCRIAACRGLHAQGKRKSTVTLKLANLSDEDMAYIALSENRARKDLAPAEELAAWAKVLSDIEGVTIQSLADKVGVDRTTMSKNLAILKLPANVLALVDQKVMPVRTARELLCLSNDDHMHKDLIQKVVKALAGNQGGYSTNYHIPDYRVTTVRGELRSVGTGHGGRGVVGYVNEARDWRALEGREFYASFDPAEFKLAYPKSLHVLPQGDASGGQVWTCNAKEWSKWSGRATREANKGEGGSGPQAKEPAKRKKGETEDEAWFKVVKRDPVVRAHLGKRLSKVGTVEDLTKEDRDALWTRVELVKSETINLPAEAQPGGRFLTKEQEQYDRASKPPLFDFSQCASCTVGATWEGGDDYRPGYRLVCSNKKQYNDRQAQGVQEWQRQLDAKREAEAEDDGRGIVKLSAVVLDAGEAEVLVRSMDGLMKKPRQVKPYPGGLWDRYDYWPLGAARFAQLVGVDLPRDWQTERRWWDEVLKFFGGDLAGFDWRLALACLLVWQASVSHGGGTRNSGGGLMSIEKRLRDLGDRDYIFGGRGGVLTVETIAYRQFPDINVDLFAGCLADRLFDQESAVQDYLAALEIRQGP